MFKPKGSSLSARVLYLLTDIFFIILSFSIPYILRWNVFFNWTDVGPATVKFRGIILPSFEHYLRLYVFWGIITISYLNYQNLYKSNRLSSIFQETALVFKAVLYSTLITGLVVFFIKAVAISRLVFMGNFLLLCLFLSIWRAIKRILLRKLIIKGYNDFNVLIVGSGKIAFELIDEIQKNPYFGLNIVGFLDDYNKKGVTVGGFKVLGSTGELEGVARRYFVDEVLITYAKDKEKISNLLELGSSLNLSMRVIPDPFELSMDVLNVYRIGHLPVFDYSIRELHGTDLFGKRIMDIFLSGSGLILLWPVFIAISAAIKLYDKGHVFYVSKRYGKKGIPFNFYKFRTMIPGADKMIDELKIKNEKDGPIFKIKDDPRVSKIGKFLRRYSIDELPQLWNVLKGDMSIVGPRPLPVGQVQTNDYSQLKRLSIKPGITGLWQIRGRSITTFHQFVKWDIWYINNWSLWLDFVIIFRTLPVVIKGKGAY
ncbi:MAG: sugar transferase [Candidatus Omnitrophota bacterium]